MGHDKALPERSTRGKRLKQAVDDEEDAADNSFWSQEFFKEEAVDDDYGTESEPEDQVDTDFDDDVCDDIKAARFSLLEQTRSTIQCAGG